MEATLLINNLVHRTKNNIQRVKKLQSLSNEQLNYKSTFDTWSILECIEHLNLYGDFYLPEIDKQIKNSKHKPTNTFKSGLLGNYFAKSMLPKEKLNKMKTFSDKNPNGSSLNIETINRFLAQQNTMLQLLKKAKKVNLTKTKTAITITNLLKLRLGDTFRVVIYHNQRHIVQAEKIMTSFSE